MLFRAKCLSGLIVLGFCLIVGVQFALGQANIFGSIVGTLKDPSGAVLPGATVTITNEGTGISAKVQTDSTGAFAARNLPAGTYTVSAELTGFQTWVGKGVIVTVNMDSPVDIALPLGTVTQQVEVTASGVLLQTQSGTVGNIIGEQSIQNLPLNGRDFTELTLLIPGSAPANLPGGFFIIGGQAVSVNGNRQDQNEYTLDGTYNNEPFFKFNSIRPSPDAIEEFNVETNITSARFGLGGAHVDLVTRSGTNDFHGSGWEFVRNDKFDANQFFRNASGVPRPAFRQNQFGGTIGGPIKKEKAFFFFDYEGLRIREASTLLGTVPTSAMLQGDLSHDTAGNLAPQIFNPFTTCGFAGNPACATDAKGNPILTRQPFPGNMIPSSLFSPVSKIYLQEYYGSVQPNRVIPGNGVNFIDTTSTQLNTNQYTARGDYHPTSKDTFFARFTLSNIPELEPQGLPTNPRHHTNKWRSLTLDDVHIFNPHVVFDMRYGWEWTFIQFYSLYPAPGFQALINAGLSGIPSKFLGFDFPLSLAMNGFTNPSTEAFNNGPDHIDQWMPNLQITHGRHNVNVGADITRIHMFHDGQFANWSFTATPTADPQNAANTGNSLASLLLGLATSASRILGNDSLDATATDWQSYLQDDIKVRPNLTLNLGVRYEYNQWFKFRTDNLGGYDVTNDQYVWAGFNPITGQPPNTRRTFVDPVFNRFYPRFGFAYRLGNNMTVRGGYGIFGGGPMSWEASQNRGNWPYAVSQGLSGLNAVFPVSTFNSVFPTFNIQAIPPNLQHTSERHSRWPYIQQWNISVQRELAKDLLLDVGYVGSRGVKMSSFSDENDPQPGPGVVGCPDPFGLLGAGACAGSVPHPRPHQNIGAVSVLTDYNNSFYHALEVKLQRHFTNGLSLLTAYTWSHNIDLSSGFGGGEPADWYNRKSYYGNADYDLRHNFTLSALYQLPFGPGRHFLGTTHGVGGKLVGGWDLDAIVRAHTGYPFPVTLNFDNLNVGGRSTPQYADEMGNPSGPQTVSEWFNTAAFAAPPQYTFGNTRKNILRGPGFTNFDLSLHKNIPLTEKTTLQFRGEFFNAFNKANFSNPGSTLQTTTYGVITGAAAPREIQFALKLMF